MNGPRLAVVVSGFPRLSETFALGELLSLEKKGWLTALFATKHGEDSKKLQPGAEQLLSKIKFLSDGDAVAQARELSESLGGSKIDGIHGYFAHKPAEVAALAAEELDVPFGFSVHAKDARKVEPGKLTAMAKKAAVVVACNADVANEAAFKNANLKLLPHGIDLGRFVATEFPQAPPFRMLAVGRLVEKKGFDVLLRAASKLRTCFSLRIIGEGPERGRLEGLMHALNLQSKVTLCGAKDQNELTKEYADTHVVIVPSVVDSNGDRDGLPNVVLEAMASARIVIAFDTAAIGSAIENGKTGILTPPKDEYRLAAVIDEVAGSLDKFFYLGQNARRFVEERYEIGKCTTRLHKVLEECYA